MSRADCSASFASVSQSSAAVCHKSGFASLNWAKSTMQPSRKSPSPRWTHTSRPRFRKFGKPLGGQRKSNLYEKCPKIEVWCHCRIVTARTVVITGACRGGGGRRLRRSAEVRRELDARPAGLVVDLLAVTFCGASGLRALVEARAQA